MGIINMKAFVIFAILAATAFAIEGEDSDVLTLTDATYEAALKENAFLFVKFYAPWCGHCKRLAPDWDKAATALKEKGSKGAIAKVDCTVEKTTCSANEVRGYPTLKFFANGELVEKYAGKRTAEDIIEYVLEKSGEKHEL